MEGKNKNQISTVLLIVGAIFIMIAGSIFVTTAWQHLPEMAKRLVLAGIVAALYIVSWRLREQNILTKTEHALYYLAAAGTGFLTVSFLGGWTTIDGYLNNYMLDTLNNADKAMWGLFATSLAVAYRFFKERKPWDFAILAFIFINMFFLVFAANVEDIAGIILLTGLVLLATYQYKESGHTFYRIAQSIGIVVINHFLNIEIYQMITDKIEMENTIAFDKWWFFAGLAIDIVLMIMLERKELICLALTANWFLTVVQICDGFSSWNAETIHSYDIIPFALTTAVGFLVMWYRGKDDEYKKLSVLHGIMAGFELVMYLVVKTEWYDDLDWDAIALGIMVVFVMLAFVTEIIDCMLNNKMAKCIIKTLTLAFIELAAIFLVITVDFDDFSVEVMSIFVGAGIYALGLIWSEKEKGIKVAQFVLTCVTLATLLLHNIEVQELSCLMFLGIVGIVMLVVAAMMNRKEYVIASSVTLSLLAIYLTREFWLSIAWWVYLFAAGVVLVGIAIKKEKEAK